MDANADHINNHLQKFQIFATNFTKAALPIIDSAIKMSTNEEVSAFGAFQSTKSKKKKNTSKQQTPRGAAAIALKKKTKNTKQQQTTNSFKFQASSSQAKKSGKTKDVDVSKILQLNDSQKPRSKAEQKKKEDLEKYLVRELEKDEGAGSDDITGEFDSEVDEDLNHSDDYSDEYIIDESGGNFGERLESTLLTDDDDLVAESLIEVVKNKKKRKNTDQSTSSLITSNGTSEIKKSKKSEALKSKSHAVIAETSKSRKSSTSKDDKVKPAEPKVGTRKMSVTTVNVTLEPLSPPSNASKVNSIDEGKRAFEWLLNPVNVEDFFDKYWETKACLIKRSHSNYFSNLISFEAIDQMLLKNHVEFTKNLDVTSYTNGVRETLNPEGRAMPPTVWDFYGQGCSIRLLNPQTFLPQLFTLSTTMQEYFHCLVGANAYLTPPNSQGFAPHYDDIEAFVLQIEGRKRWKLYKPRSAKEMLPRFSSPNFTQKEIGKPILDEVLGPGDVLYFPRGTIHQASTEPGYHSLHITLSVYQKQSYADLFEKMMPLLLQKAIASNIDLRRGLPLNTFQNAGIAHSLNSTEERANLQKKVTQLLHKCIKQMPLDDILDAAVDQVAKKFQHEALPPEILPEEKQRTVFGSTNTTNDRGECVCDYDIEERTNVRLLRANILRLVNEENKIRIYYYLDNSKEYCEYDPNFIEIEPKEAASVEILIKSYPAYVSVSQLPLPDDEQKVNLVTALWERGLLMTEKPFK